MHEEGYINFGERRLHYIKAGNGAKLLVAFHGYGNDALLFHNFFAILGNDYTTVSIDLPFHSQSHWPEGGLFTKEDLALLIHSLLKEFKKDKLSILGYSLGGRVCLNILELLPEKIEQAVLIAPDGLVLSQFYFFVTRTWLGKKMFSKFLNGSIRYNGYIDWVHERGWLDPSRHKFLMKYLSDERSRKFILKVWPAMRYLLPDITKTQTNIKKHNIPVDIFMGKYDRVIPVKNAVKFKKQIPQIHLHILDKGHLMFDANSITQIAGSLLSQ